MMRAQQHSSCSPNLGWLLAAFAALIVMVQSLRLHSLTSCNAAAAATHAAVARAQHENAALGMANITAALPPAASAALASQSAGDALSSSSSSQTVAAVSAPAPAAAAAAPFRDAAEPRPRLLVVTAEQPTECSTAAAQWLGSRAMRNRMQYAQAHGYQLYWCTDSVDPDYAGIKESGMWNKPALLSKLLQSNITDGIDWLLWIDSDAIFMDMAFELPLDEYAANGHNLVLWGEPRKVDTVAEAAPDYFGLNAGVMLLRNNAWTRAFLARILAAGDDIAGSTAVQGAALKGMCDRAYDCVVSDQSTIVWLLYSQPELWRAQTLLEKRFALNGHWQEYYGRLVSGSLKLNTSIWGSDRVPFVMHFAGCQLCSGRTDAHYANWDDCRDAMAQALNHVEDWALAQLGLKHANLTSLEVVRADGPPTYPEPPPPPPDEQAAAADAHGMTAPGAPPDDDSADGADALATSASSSVDDATLAALQPPESLP